MEQKKTENTKKEPVNRPNETGSVSVQGHIKIFDPNTKEVFVNKRS
jgi:hypothetical protein